MRCKWKTNEKGDLSCKMRETGRLLKMGTILNLVFRTNQWLSRGDDFKSSSFMVAIENTCVCNLHRNLDDRMNDVTDESCKKVFVEMGERKKAKKIETIVGRIIAVFEFTIILKAIPTKKIEKI